MPPRIFSRFLTPLAAAALLLAACGPSWQEVKAPEGGFSVKMRGEARVEKHEVDTPIGRITGHWYSHELNEAVYGVGYADWPAVFVQNSAPRQIFTIVRQGWLKRIDGTLQGDDTDIRIDGNLGMEFTASGKLDERDALLRGRLYLVGNTLYQVVVFGSREKVALSDVDRFMGSFKLIPRAANVNVMDLNVMGGKPPPVLPPEKK